MAVAKHLHTGFDLDQTLSGGRNRNAPGQKKTCQSLKMSATKAAPGHKFSVYGLRSLHILILNGWELRIARSCPCRFLNTSARNVIINLKPWFMATGKRRARNARAKSLANSFPCLPCRPRVPRAPPLRWEPAGVAATPAERAHARCLTWIDAAILPVFMRFQSHGEGNFRHFFLVTAVSFNRSRYALLSHQSFKGPTYGSSSQSTCRCIFHGADMGCGRQIAAFCPACSGQKHQRKWGRAAGNGASDQGRWNSQHSA